MSVRGGGAEAWRGGGVWGWGVNVEKDVGGRRGRLKREERGRGGRLKGREERGRGCGGVVAGGLRVRVREGEGGVRGVRGGGEVRGFAGGDRGG